MRHRAWAWCLAFDALLLTITPMAGMSGLFGIEPMSVARANTLWIFALVLVAASFVLWNREEHSPHASAESETAHCTTSTPATERLWNL